MITYRFTSEWQGKMENKNPQQHQEIISQEVLEQDKVLYELCLYLPKQARESAFAVAAFHSEIAKTRSVVSETAIGLMRLLWWREAVQGLYKGEVKQGQPVLEGLHQAIDHYDLPLQLFEEMTYGYEFDLEDKQPSHFDGLETYFETTYGKLFALLSLLDKPSQKLPKPFFHAFGLLRLLRDYHKMMERQHCLFPETLLVKHDLRVSDLYQGKKRDLIQAMIQECVTYAEEKLTGFKGSSPFQKAVLAHLRLEIKAFRAVQFDLFDGRLNSLPLLRSMRIWLSSSSLRT